MNKIHKSQQVKELIEAIESNESVMIYGAGKHTAELFSSTNLAMKNILGIVDRKVKNPEMQTLFGYQLFPPEKINELEPKVVVVSSFEYQQEIVEQLRADFNFTGKVIIFYEPHDVAPYYQVEIISPLENIYHCCVPKTASQWFYEIFNDPEVYRYCGLKTYQFYNNLNRHFSNEWLEQNGRREVIEKVIEASFNLQFPAGTIVTPLYLDYHSFQMIRKPGNYKAFFVIRDPRDLVVSWYYSLKDTHPIHTPRVSEIRHQLNSVNKTDGLIMAINELAKGGYFNAQNSWIQKAEENQQVKIFKFENLFGVNRRMYLQELFKYLEIPLNLVVFDRIMGKYALHKKQQKNPHYRQGASGDWANHLESVHLDLLNKYQGDLINFLGYDQ